MRIPAGAMRRRCDTPIICIHNATLLAGYARMETLRRTGRGRQDCRRLLGEALRPEDVFRTVPRYYDAGGAYLAPASSIRHIHGFAGFGTEDMSVGRHHRHVRPPRPLRRHRLLPDHLPMDLDDMDRSIRGLRRRHGQGNRRARDGRAPRRPVRLAGQARRAETRIRAARRPRGDGATVPGRAGAISPT